MKHYFFAFLSVFFLKLSYQAEAQRCAQPRIDSIRFAQNPALKQNRLEFEKLIALRKSNNRSRKENTAPTGIITIPVVVHVLYNSKNQNISDAQIASQISVLNKDFRKLNSNIGNLRSQFTGIAADMEVEFILAGTDPYCMPTNGITRHFTNKSSYSIDTEERLIKSYGFWPSDQYLNIWVCNLRDQVLGYGQFPLAPGLGGLDVVAGDSLSDGVVLSTNYVGESSHIVAGKFNLGRTGTHEVGHWLGGLLHTWGDGATCGTDYCDDTPVEANSNYECSYISSTACAFPAVYPMIENYMDYTYDTCMCAFTKDQKTRMRDAIAICPRRNKLLTSKGGVQLASLSYKLPLYENFESNNWLTIWDTNAVTGNNNFDIANVGAYSNSSKSINVLNTSGDLKTELIIPTANFINLEQPVLSFDYALASVSGQTCKLSLLYSLGCTSNWQTLQTWSESDLNTYSHSGTFIPNASQWANKKNLLQHLAGSQFVELKFVWETSSPIQLYLDNIQFVENKFISSIYPNPTKDFLNIHVQFPGVQTWTVEMFDTYGSKVLLNDIVSESDQVKKISLAGLQAGVYYVNIISSYGVDKKKIIVSVAY